MKQNLSWQRVFFRLSQSEIINKFHEPIYVTYSTILIHENLKDYFAFRTKVIFRLICETSFLQVQILPQLRFRDKKKIPQTERWKFPQF